MKTYKNLFTSIYSFENLYRAAKQAQKGKKNNEEVARFHNRLEENLLDLKASLEQKTYLHGDYTTFYVLDPKKRMISAAPYRDRVLHHALCNVIEPLFEKSFITDSYANRKGKGTHKAITRFQAFARQYAYVLKCDIRKFFPSIDHVILKQEIRKKIACKDTLWLIDQIIDNSNPQEEIEHDFSGDDPAISRMRRKGLPIGNLTLQFWANVYMDAFDHFIKDHLGHKAYVRYVDDFVILSNSKEELHRLKIKIQDFLVNYRLRTHPTKTQIQQVEKGVPFLGFMVYKGYKHVLKPKLKRYKRHVQKTIKQMQSGEVAPQKLEDKLNSWLGHLRFGASQRSEYNFFFYIRDSGVNLLKHPRNSWRVLEQQ
ncbi:MAG: reverse transcriptase/maturase family protein [Spirosomataceae bacterium]